MREMTEAGKRLWLKTREMGFPLERIMKIHAGMPMENDIETIGSTKNTNANEK